MILSKSRYVQGLNCGKAMWMYEWMPEAFTAGRDHAAVAQGNELGDLARRYFGTFTEVHFQRSAHAMAQETHELMASGTDVICEATFIHDGTLYLVDILRRTERGWAMIEVKGSVDHGLDEDSRLQRARPKVPKLVSNVPLRLLVQRKLNRCWSPDEICGWMKKHYPEDLTMRLSPETIYRALLLREDSGLHKRFAVKLRTGRRIRKTRWRRRIGRGSRIINMTMIDKRPPEGDRHTTTVPKSPTTTT